MEATNTMPKIYSAIAEVMRKTSAISKGRKNQQQGFQFRGIDDVMNELHGTLAECGVFIVPEVLEENRTEGHTKSGSAMFYTRLKIKFTFYAEDGSSVSSTVIGEAMDTGDKASNKALSIGYKYACLQVFCIPTEDDKDPDAQTHEFQKGPAQQPQQQQRPAPAPKRGAQQKQQQGPQLAGGPDTPQQFQKIKALLNATGADGRPVFGNSDVKKYTDMRTEKTADELIKILTEIVALNSRMDIPGAQIELQEAPAPKPQGEDFGQEEMVF